MSHFKAKMHQIRFRLGLHDRPLCDSLQCSQSPGPLTTSMGREGLRWDGEGRVRGDGKGMEGLKSATPSQTSFRRLCLLVGRVPPLGLPPPIGVQACNSRVTFRHKSTIRLLGLGWKSVMSERTEMVRMTQNNGYIRYRDVTTQTSRKRWHYTNYRIKTVNQSYSVYLLSMI